MKKGSGVIVKIIIAVAVLAAAATCIIIYRERISAWLRGLKDKVVKKFNCEDDFVDFDFDEE